MSKTVALHTLGCKLNFSETTAMGRLLENEGFLKKNFDEVADVRVGKHITIKLNASSKEEANAKVEEACKKLLANPIMEGYKFEIVQE